jgi:hypothetical protein
MGWVFLGLALAMTWVALNPQVRQGVHWGRTPPVIPMSGIGFAAWIGAFLTIAAAGFGWIPLAAIFLTVPALVCAGVFDSWRHGRCLRDRENR